MRIMKKSILLSIAAAVSFLSGMAAFPAYAAEPSGTYLFAVKDSLSLFMDVYGPAEGSVTSIDGRNKPTLIYIFGGGFKEGARYTESQVECYQKYNEEGYRVIAIDYRLGLKGVKKMGIAQSKLLKKAIRMAVEDLFSATSFIVDNAEALGVEPDNIVICGSSAGAITALQADWEICNRTDVTSLLPEGFRYAGVISFSGAIYSDVGAIRYGMEPAPTLMLHGTSDKLVNYKQIHFLNQRFAGSSVIVKTFEKGGYNYNLLRFKERGHEIASAMSYCYPETFRFLETNVMKKEKRIIDAMIDDPAIFRPSWGSSTAKDLYK